MKTIVIIIILSSAALEILAQDRILNNLAIQEDSTFGLDQQKALVNRLNDLVESTQDFIVGNEDKVELMAIVGNSNKPISLPDKEWPENVTTSINIIRSKLGAITYYAEFPTSESGDWFIGYRYYFDESSGVILVFQRVANFFNSTCQSGLAKELSTYYFSTTGEILAKSYSLVNNDGEDLASKLCFFPYDYKYDVVKSSDDILD